MSTRMSSILAVIALISGLALLICGLRFEMNGLTWVGAMVMIIGVGLMVLTAPRRGGNSSGGTGAPVLGGVDSHKSTDGGSFDGGAGGGGDGGGGGG